MSNSLQPHEPQHTRPPCPKPMSIESVMPSNHLILSRSLLLLPPIFPSIRVFSNESALYISGPKNWSFSFNISPSNEHPGLISFRMVWLDLHVVQGTLKSLLQHHSSKASIFHHSAFKQCGYHPKYWKWQRADMKIKGLIFSIGLPWWLKYQSPPSMQESWVQPLGQEDPLEKGMAIHSSILAWGIPWTEEPGGLQTMQSQRVRHD